MCVCAMAIVYVTINEGGLFKSIVPGHRFNTLQQRAGNLLEVRIGRSALLADWKDYSILMRIYQIGYKYFFKSVFCTRLFQVRRVKSIKFPTDFFVETALY